MPLEPRVVKNVNLDAETNYYGFLLPVFRIKSVLIKSTYLIGVNIMPVKFLSLMSYKSQEFMLIKLINFALDLLNYDQLLT